MGGLWIIINKSGIHLVCRGIGNQTAKSGAFIINNKYQVIASVSLKSSEEQENILLQVLENSYDITEKTIIFKNISLNGICSS